MADEQTSPWDINSTPPHGFVRGHQTVLKLHYLIRENGDYVFRYKAKKGRKGDLNFWQDPIDDTDWIIFLIGRNYVAEIDIDISDADTTVFVEIVDEGGFENMFWSPTTPAIRTLKYRKRLFGNLQYWAGGTWTRNRPTRPPARRISFDARYNDRIHREDKHKFSFNVLLPVLGEFEIDPEIKNPSS